MKKSEIVSGGAGLISCGLDRSIEAPHGLNVQVAVRPDEDGRLVITASARHNGTAAGMTQAMEAIMLSLATAL